jgi:hypothetical protein
MRHRIVLGAVALGIAWLYLRVLVLTIGVAVALAPPTWWSPLFTTHQSAITTWVVVCHTSAVIVVALPFSYFIARLYGRVGILLALALTIALYAFDPLPSVIAYFHTYSARLIIITLFDAVKLVGILPALVWAFSRLTSNNRLERTGVASVSLGGSR